MARTLRFGAAAWLAAALLAAGCASGPTPLRDSRPALGTVVTIEAYGTDEAALRIAIDAAFDEIARVERALDAYSPTSTIAAFNADPYTERRLPEEAITILDEVERLGVGAEFSSALLAPVRLYGFGTTPTVPAPDDLSLSVAAARGFRRPTAATGVFARLKTPDPRLEPGGPLAPGLDFGGAAK
ncbi:MAG: FAD:protein FMN transferase, partial [Anaerosomatales bacterium]|nr:FAD:protein FMN transferase [Anaerosomatales bacterium]